MIPFIDIHCHSYYHEDNTAMLLNVFPGENEKFKHPCYFSVGLHPWHVNAGTLESDLEWIEQQAGNPRVVAIGEIGLDKIIDVPWADQEHAFREQVSLAEKLNKPMVIHCVKSYNELIVYRNVSRQKLPWIFHWYNSSHEIAHELIRRNCYLSFGHMLFKEGSKAFKTFPEIPVERVFLETDDAGISIKETYHRASALKGMPLNHLLHQINSNFIACFGTR